MPATMIVVQAGQRFGRGVVIDPDIRIPMSSGSRRDRGARLRCDCGNSYETTLACLRSGKVQSCGCIARERARSTETAAFLARIARTPEGRARAARAGRTPQSRARAARLGRTWGPSPENLARLARLNQSPEERARRADQARTHGLHDHPLYGTWTLMMRRCHNERDRQYARYGGRGITVCAEWHDVRNFVAWIDENLGPRPERHSLDRIDNNDGYRPGNVRWATASQQASNRNPYRKRPRGQAAKVRQSVLAGSNGQDAGEAALTT